MRPHRPTWSTDADLVRAIVDQRSEQALVEFARRHAASIESPLYVILNDDPDSIAEARQDVLLSIWNRVGTCNENIDAWLRTVARNSALSVVRKRQRRPKTAQLADTPDDTRLPEITVGDQVTLRCALDKISPRERLIVELKYIEQLSDAEIATAMYLSRESVRKTVGRARKSLIAAFGRCSK
jgi:RNA polymerase sigma factor (sigma-70 family)